MEGERGGARLVTSPNGLSTQAELDSKTLTTLLYHISTFDVKAFNSSLKIFELYILLGAGIKPHGPQKKPRLV